MFFGSILFLPGQVRQRCHSHGSVEKLSSDFLRSPHCSLRLEFCACGASTQACPWKSRQKRSHPHSSLRAPLMWPWVKAPCPSEPELPHAPKPLCSWHPGLIETEVAGSMSSELLQVYFSTVLNNISWPFSN